MQYAFYYDQSKCIGCNACVVACKDWNGVNPGPARWRRLTVTEEGSFPNLSVFNLVIACNHCANPSCIPACPLGAIYKRQADGIVIVDRSLCQSIKACQAKCPFNSPQFADSNEEPVQNSSWAVPHPMQKCTFCWDRWAVGKMPACVDSCPMRALDAGDITALMAKYPNAVRTVVGFPDSTRDSSGNVLATGDTQPSILFNPKTPNTPLIM